MRASTVIGGVIVACMIGLLLQLLQFDQAHSRLSNVDVSDAPSLPFETPEGNASEELALPPVLPAPAQSSATTANNESHATSIINPLNDQSLDWHLLDFDLHKGMQQLTKDLNKLYRKEKSLHEVSYHADGFEWVDYQDNENSVLAYLRVSKKQKPIMVVCNFTPSLQEGYRIGVPFEKTCKEILNTDETKYGGSGAVNKAIKIESTPSHHKQNSILLKLPPLGVVVLQGS